MAQLRNSGGSNELPHVPQARRGEARPALLRQQEPREAPGPRSAGVVRDCQPGPGAQRSLGHGSHGRHVEPDAPEVPSTRARPPRTGARGLRSTVRCDPRAARAGIKIRWQSYGSSSTGSPPPRSQEPVQRLDPSEKPPERGKSILTIPSALSSDGPESSSAWRWQRAFNWEGRRCDRRFGWAGASSEAYRVGIP